MANNGLILLRRGWNRDGSTTWSPCFLLAPVRPQRISDDACRSGSRCRGESEGFEDNRQGEYPRGAWPKPQDLCTSSSNKRRCLNKHSCVDLWTGTGPNPQNYKRRLTIRVKPAREAAPKDQHIFRRAKVSLETARDGCLVGAASAKPITKEHKYKAQGNNVHGRAIEGNKNSNMETKTDNNDIEVLRSKTDAASNQHVN